MLLRVPTIGALPQGFLIGASEKRGRCPVLKAFLDVPLGVPFSSRFPFGAPI